MSCSLHPFLFHKTRKKQKASGDSTGDTHGTYSDYPHRSWHGFQYILLQGINFSIYLESIYSKPKACTNPTSLSLRTCEKPEVARVETSVSYMRRKTSSGFLHTLPKKESCGSFFQTPSNTQPWQHRLKRVIPSGGVRATSNWREAEAAAAFPELDV